MFNGPSVQQVFVFGVMEGAVSNLSISSYVPISLLPPHGNGVTATACRQTVPVRTCLDVTLFWLATGAANGSSSTATKNLSETVY